MSRFFITDNVNFINSMNCVKRNRLFSYIFALYKCICICICIYSEMNFCVVRYSENHGSTNTCHFILSINTPYNRLLRRQITASTTDQGKFSGTGVGEVFLFAKINKRICGLQLMMENILNVWRYCSSNLTLFQVQISFLSARQNLRFKKIA